MYSIVYYAGRSKSKSKAGKGKSDSKTKSEAAQKPSVIELPPPEGGTSIDTLDKDSPVLAKPGPSLELKKVDAPPQLSKYGKTSGFYQQHRYLKIAQINQCLVYRL